ncbi:Gfo/Idh/MocA family protein [Alterinioella nitratireducens]|uniref:Gfo/Idh/MocA family protein n=1 Tax=Alterinioella nitratireducens TaxID=2735915 RepID=UPI00405880F2
MAGETQRTSASARGTPEGVTVIGCGFVADLYMRSLRTFPQIQVLGAFDHDAQRMAAFCAHWSIPALPDMGAALATGGLILNLTNPTSHADVIRASLEAGRHVFSEKPMVLDLDTAKSLRALAGERRVQLATAPSSVLGEAAQTLGHALRNGLPGTPRLIYAELDDGFIPQAPVEAWISESGAPWPFADEFRTGCTLEHAGYYLSWLIAHFGAVTRVVTATAEVIPAKRGLKDCAPDVSVAMLYFASGPVARLTCSIAAPHDHRLRIVGDDGVLQVDKAWDNAAPVRHRKRIRIRRRLLESPVAKRIRLPGPTHPHLPRKGAAAMNFALGPAEMLEAIRARRPSRLAGDYALHLTEVTLACQKTGVHEMTTSCEKMKPMPWAC